MRVKCHKVAIMSEITFWRSEDRKFYNLVYNDPKRKYLVPLDYFVWNLIEQQLQYAPVLWQF